MNLARNEFRQLSQIYEQDNILDIIEKNNVRVIIAGDLEGKLKSAFPDVREGFLKVQERTRNNTRMTMYLCFAYDSIH
jgi:undecaprenyl pyrophosphate synthase